MRHSLIVAAMLVALVGSSACSKQPPPAPPAPPPAQAKAEMPDTDELGQPSDPRFIGKIWVSTTPGHSRGTLMIFLADRTLLMTSCFEPYRISKWGVAGDRIRWIEDAIPIEAIISMSGDNDLSLQLAGQDKVQSYVTATVPYVCPDMPK